jgi:hypothetical protein
MHTADEILYHARVHPEQRCNTLTESQIAALHLQTSEVCRIAVEAKADDSKFPEDWLFKHRWVNYTFSFNLMPTYIYFAGKGQKGETHYDIGPSTKCPQGLTILLILLIAHGRAGDNKMDHCWRSYVRVCHRAPVPDWDHKIWKSCRGMYLLYSSYILLNVDLSEIE